MESLLIMKDVNYGASKTSSAKNSALDPVDLADGALGIYGFVNTSTNPNAFVLITDGGSEASGTIPVSTFLANSLDRKVQFAVGIGNNIESGVSHIMSPPVQISGGQVLNIYSKNYVAPVKQVAVLGYNGTAGTSLNLPTLSKFDDGQVKLAKLNAPETGFMQPYDKQRISISVGDSTDEYSISKLVISNIEERTDLKVKGKIIVNGSGSAISNTATASVANGSSSVTTSAAHGVDEGDYIAILSDVYKVLEAPSTTTLTLDRPYTGATAAAVANANVRDLGDTLGSIGIQFTSTDNDYEFLLGADGIFENATIKITTPYEEGIGTESQMVDIEKSLIATRGTSDQLTTYIPRPASRVESGGTYDQYVVNYTRADQPGVSAPTRVMNVNNNVILAFVSSVADTAGKNQSDFEDILSALYSAFPTLY